MRSTENTIAICIGCGCDDDHACRGGCSWLAVDRSDGLGVCSGCPQELPRWNHGKHRLSAKAVEAATLRIQAEDAPECRRQAHGR